MKDIKKLKKTMRGFPFRNFTDTNGYVCSLQISSAIPDSGERMIWLGSDDDGVKTFIPNTGGWKNVNNSELALKLGVETVQAHTRMHLTQSQVKDLLPYLTKFVNEGEI